MDNVVKIFDNTLEYIPSDKGLNYIICDDYSELFFGVYHVTINGAKFIGEGVDTIKGSPVIKIPVILEDKTHDVLFALKSDSNETGIVINLNSLSNGRKILLDEKKEAEQIVEEVGLEPIQEIVEAVNITSEELKVDIKRYKEDALRVISENFNDKKAKLESLQESLKNVINKNVEDLKQSTLLDLQEFKTDVISSVETIVESNKIDTYSSIAEINSLKENISVLVNGYVADLELTASEKVAALNELREQVNFEVSTKLHEFESEVNSYKQITEDEFKKLEKYIAESEQNLVSKNQSGVEANQKLLDAIVKKSTDITKFVESKVSSLQSFTDKKTASIAKAIETKLAEFDNKTKIVDEKVDLIEKTLSEKVVDYIGEFTAAVNEKLSGINAIKADIESAGDNQASKLQQIGDQLIEAVEAKVKNANLVAVKKEDLSSLKKQLEERINTESANLKKYVAGYGGGGSVAQQFAAGGTMNGALDVTGNILSGGRDLASIFATAAGSGYQTLTFTPSTGNLLIAPIGNTVSLSAFTNVLSAHNLKTDYIDFTPLSAAPTFTNGRLYYDTNEKTLVFTDGDPVLTYPINKMMWTIGINKTGVTIPKGTVVYLSGAQGNRGKMWPALATDDYRSADTIGITMGVADINQEGYIMTIGELNGIDTRLYAEGTTLYLSPLTAGALTDVKPQAPNHVVKVGFSLNSTVNGKVYVEIDNGYELDELHNVRIVSPQNNQTLVYNSVSGLWVNSFLSGGGSDSQTLSFNESNAELSISGGNTVSLSALSGVGSGIITGAYLPLSGGTVTGSTIFTGTLSATLIEATSAKITVIDITQYELSGFSVDGNVTVNGTISSNSILFANGGNSNNWNNTYTTLNANSGSWNSVYSTVSATSASWLQTLTFDENTSILSISNSNSVSLSALNERSVFANYLPLTGGTLTGVISTNQDIEITDSTKGIILKSPSNFKYRVTVNDAGELVTTLV